jgi:hypothetical protein
MLFKTVDQKTKMNVGGIHGKYVDLINIKIVCVRYGGVEV